MKFLRGKNFPENPQALKQSFIQDQQNLLPNLVKGKQHQEKQQWCNSESVPSSELLEVLEKSKEESRVAIQPYRKEILEHLCSLPTLGPFPMCNYFDRQTDIAEHMRIVLLNWLIDVHLKYQMSPETFFLTVNIIDQYLSVRDINRSELQLLGITAMWIAAKYEETYQVPKIHNLVYVCDSAYSAKQILRMQTKILQQCQFNILQPNTLSYFSTILEDLQLPQLECCIGRYLLELALLDINMRKYLPKITAISTIFFLVKLIDSPSDKSHIEKLIISCNFSVEQIRECARDLCLLWRKSCASSALESLKKKFGRKEYLGVSSIQATSYLQARQQERSELRSRGMDVE